VKYPTAKQFIYLTNEGVHFATFSSQQDPDRKILLCLLKQPKTLRLHQFLNLLKEESETLSLEHTIALFNKGYLVAKNTEDELDKRSIAESLPNILKELSDNQHCAIADQEGFLLAHSGFDLNQAEQAAILAVEILELQAKRQHNIQQASGERSFISIVDNDGQSQLRFVPIYLNQQVFILAIKGNPQLKNANFIHLVWLLGQRYL